MQYMFVIFDKYIQGTLFRILLLVFTLAFFIFLILGTNLTQILSHEF